MPPAISGVIKSGVNWRLGESPASISTRWFAADAENALHVSAQFRRRTFALDDLDHLARRGTPSPRPQRRPRTSTWPVTELISR